MSDIGHLTFIQPIITTYRIPLFEDLSNRLNGNFSVWADMPSADFGVEEVEGFKFHKIKWHRIGPFLYMQPRDFRRLWSEGSHFIHYADFKCISLWMMLFLCAFSKKCIYLHGQGGYKQKSPIATIIYNVVVAMADGYIAYTEWSSQFLKRRVLNFLHKKISYVNNSLYLEQASYEDKKTAIDILFIGRLREGSNIEMLLQAASELNLKVHVVGGGSKAYEVELKHRFPEHIYYGAVYEWNRQVDISRRCFVGVYPGDAGLSVVTYLALGLPVVVHEDIVKHMGPEPTYISSNVGVLFVRNDIGSLKNAILEARNIAPELVRSKYESVSGFAMAKSFISIILQEKE